MLVALDEHADLFVHVEREGAAHLLHAPTLEPLGRRVDQRLADLVVVDGVEEAEEAGLVAVQAQVLVVDLRGRAPDQAAVLPRCEEGDLAALEEGVLRGGEARAEVELEGRDPGRIALEHHPTRADEVVDVLTGRVLADLDAHDAPQ